VARGAQRLYFLAANGENPAARLLAPSQSGKHLTAGVEGIDSSQKPWNRPCPESSPDEEEPTVTVTLPVIELLLASVTVIV
jgi:hypothetical protein